jgi:hypothetical protein
MDEKLALLRTLLDGCDLADMHRMLGEVFARLVSAMCPIIAAAARLD